MQVKLSRFVEPDLERIADFIASHNPTRAVAFVAEIRREMLRIGQNPLGYRLRPEIGKDVRMSIHGRYVILFRILVDFGASGDVVFVDRVLNGARDLPVQAR